MAARTTAVFLTIGLVMSMPASAQARWGLAGGYSFLQDPPDRTNFPAGWVAAVDVELTPWLAAVGDVSGHRNSNFDIELSTIAILGGARASARIGWLVEFAQLLAGVVRSSSTVLGAGASEHDPALQPGGGIEVDVAPQLSLRGQIDYRLVGGGPGPPIADPRHQFRYSASIVYHHR